MDSGYPYRGDARRVERAFDRHLAVAHRQGVPLVIGEWGNLPEAEGSAAYAADVGRLLDRHGVGSAYWDHVPGREDEDLFRAAMRPYVRRVAGRLVESGYDAGSGTLRASIAADPSVGAPTVIAAPAPAYPGGVDVRLSGVPAESAHDAARGLVLVWADRAGDLEVEVAPR